jgi:hypothetical protein
MLRGLRPLPVTIHTEFSEIIPSEVEPFLHPGNAGGRGHSSSWVRRLTFEVAEVGRKRIFRTDRLPNSVGAYRLLVDTTRDPVVEGTGLAEIRVHELERLIAHIEAGEDAQAVHFRACGRANAVKFADGQPFDEGGPHLRRNDILPVRLTMIRCGLRQKLIVGDTGRSVKARLSAAPGQVRPLAPHEIVEIAYARFYAMLRKRITAE